MKTKIFNLVLIFSFAAVFTGCSDTLAIQSAVKLLEGSWTRYVQIGDENPVTALETWTFSQERTVSFSQVREEDATKLKDVSGTYQIYINSKVEPINLRGVLIITFPETAEKHYYFSFSEGKLQLVEESSTPTDGFTYDKVGGIQ